MNTYVCCEENLDNEFASKIVAETASKARYHYYLHTEVNTPYFEMFRGIGVKVLHKFKVSDLFGNIDQFNRMKKSRFIEFAKIGMNVEVCGKRGTICGSNGSMNLDICLDGEYHLRNYHPWWRVVYIDDEGSVIKEFKKGWEE